MKIWRSPPAGQGSSENTELMLIPAVRTASHGSVLLLLTMISVYWLSSRFKINPPKLSGLSLKMLFSRNKQKIGKSLWLQPEIIQHFWLNSIHMDPHFCVCLSHPPLICTVKNISILSPRDLKEKQSICVFLFLFCFFQSRALRCESWTMACHTVTLGEERISSSCSCCNTSCSLYLWSASWAELTHHSRHKSGGPGLFKLGSY